MSENGMLKASHMVSHTLGNVQVKEVAVEYRLDAAGDDSNRIEEALRVVAVDPVEDVECSIHAKSEQVMTGDRLCLAGLADHKQLRKNRHRLQVDGERPQDLNQNTQPIYMLVSGTTWRIILAVLSALFVETQ